MKDWKGNLVDAIANENKSCKIVSLREMALKSGIKHIKRADALEIMRKAQALCPGTKLMQIMKTKNDSLFCSICLVDNDIHFDDEITVDVPEEETMKKSINMKMTNARAMELGYTPHRDIALVPVEIDLDILTPAARWIAEHITSTHVMDEARDIMPVFAEDSMTIIERERAKGHSDESTIRFLGEDNVNQRYHQPITFPVYGKKHNRPEDVLEEAVKQIVSGGARRIYIPNTDEEFCFC